MQCIPVFETPPNLERKQSDTGSTDDAARIGFEAGADAAKIKHHGAVEAFKLDVKSAGKAKFLVLSNRELDFSCQRGPKLSRIS